MSYLAEHYLHDLDRRAFAALEGVPGYRAVLDAWRGSDAEKAAQLELLSQAVRLGSTQMPEIYDFLPPICEKLGIDVPDLYLVSAAEPNAYAAGIEQPFIIVTTKLVETVPERLVPSILAHECGHIACGHFAAHVVARQIAGQRQRGRGCAGRFHGRDARQVEGALALWNRCAELTADRACALCDGGADNLIDTLLFMEGYDVELDHDELIAQAADLRARLDGLGSVALLEQLGSDESHPRLLVRIAECHAFCTSPQFADILAGTYHPPKEELEEIEEASGEVSVRVPDRAGSLSLEEIDRQLALVESQIERYTCEADRADYAFALFSGLMAGALDSLVVGETRVTEEDIVLSHRQVNAFIQDFAKRNGYKGDRLKGAIAFLEEKYPVAQDNVWKGAGLGITPKNHHLADLAHHPTPAGLVAALVVQFLRVGTFVSKDGEWHFLPVKTEAKDIAAIVVPVILTAFLNWLVGLVESGWDSKADEPMPAGLRRLLRLFAQTPLLVEIAKCANNWLGHLVSDMGGSKNTPGGGMGIPGVLLSLLYEIAALPGFKDSGLSAFVNDLYQNKKLDLRHELAALEVASRQALPVLFYELYVRIAFFVGRFAGEVARHGGVKGVDWSRTVPFGNRTVERMITVAALTFTMADTADAAVRAAVASGGEWVLFSGNFVARFNFIGAGRAAFAVVREVSSEARETQLIHERMLLSEARADLVISRLQEYKRELDLRLATYLAEDLSAFSEGLDLISRGAEEGDSDVAIRGSVTIQKVLGRDPQFSSQEEFDELMASEEPLVL